MFLDYTRYHKIAKCTMSAQPQWIWMCALIMLVNYGSSKNTNCQVTGQIARFESRLAFSLWFTDIPSTLLSFPCHLKSECFGKSFMKAWNTWAIFIKLGHFASATCWEMLHNAQPIVVFMNRWSYHSVFGDKELVLYLLLEKELIFDVRQKKKLTNLYGKDSNWVMLSKNGKTVLKAALH